MKLCKSCGDTKPLSEFHKNKLKKDGYAFKCKECRNEENALWYQHNKENVAKSRSDRVNEIRIRRLKFRDKHKNKLSLEYKIWAASNKDKCAARDAKRRAAEKRACPQWLNPGHWTEIDGFYLYCKIFVGHEVDHIVPLQGRNVRGLHVPWNLQILTIKANRAKGNRYG